VIGVSGSLYGTVNSGATWTALASGTTMGLNDMTFVSSSEFWIGADNGVMVQSLNGGQTWGVQQLQTFASINGVAKAGSSVVIAGEYGFVGRKSGAQSWTFADTGVNISANWITFTDFNNGVVVGQDGLILKTTNGGTTWDHVANGLTFDSFYGVEMVEGGRIWMVGDLGALLHSSNGGANWVQQTTNTTNSLMSASFVDQNNGWTVGDLGLLIRTTNGGATWAQLPTGVQEILFGVKFKSLTTGWIVGDYGIIRRTNDGGTTWSPQTSNTSATLFSVDFLDYNIGFCAGSNGTILKTTNGGGTWIVLPTGTQRTLYVVGGATLASLWAVGDSGTVLHSTNGGTSWSSVFALTGFDLFGLKVVSDSVAWISGDNGTILSVGRDHITAIGERNEDEHFTPEGFHLHQNYPNPANPTATIRYSLEQSGHVRLEIFDLLGKQAGVLVDQDEAPGTYAVQMDGHSLASGVYFYRLTLNGRSAAKKCLIMK
jgi:photosystem II stability/assembly factor-like uncharacterized protein